MYSSMGNMRRRVSPSPAKKPSSKKDIEERKEDEEKDQEKKTSRVGNWYPGIISQSRPRQTVATARTQVNFHPLRLFPNPHLSYKWYAGSGTFKIVTLFLGINGTFTWPSVLTSFQLTSSLKHSVRTLIKSRTLSS